MKPHAMTEAERTLVSMALRALAMEHSLLAHDATGAQRVVDQFKRQAQMAEALAVLFDDADLIDIWPYSLETE